MIDAGSIIPQRTLELEADTPIPAVKPSKKGIPIGAKWEFTEEEVLQLLKVMPNLRNRIMLRLGIYLGLRISELLSLTIADVTLDNGEIRDVVIIPSERLKGGKPSKPKVYERPEGHPDLCFCRDCQLYRGEIRPKPRRKPDDLKKYLSPSAQKLVRMLLDRLAKTRTGLTDRSRFLFESRKTRWHKTDPQRNRPISRQAAWEIIKSAAKRAHLQYISRAGTHSLRKSFAMNTLEVTGDMRKVMAGLGHRSQNTTEHYCRHDSKQMFEALRDASIRNSQFLEIGLVA
jgi:site-specific recombinase XerD